MKPIDRQAVLGFAAFEQDWHELRNVFYYSHREAFKKWDSCCNTMETVRDWLQARYQFLS